MLKPKSRNMLKAEQHVKKNTSIFPLSLSSSNDVNRLHVVSLFPSFPRRTALGRRRKRRRRRRGRSGTQEQENRSPPKSKPPPPPVSVATDEARDNEMFSARDLLLARAQLSLPPPPLDEDGADQTAACVTRTTTEKTIDDVTSSF